MKTIMRFRAIDLLDAMACFKDQIDTVVEAERVAAEAARKTDRPDERHVELPDWAFDDATITIEAGWIAIHIGDTGHVALLADDLTTASSASSASEDAEDAYCRRIFRAAQILLAEKDHPECDPAAWKQTVSKLLSAARLHKLHGPNLSLLAEQIGASP